MMSEKEKKGRQSSKIRELGEALVTMGFLTLDEQAEALGLCRSTVWTVLKGNHKCCGLSATIINRMWMSPRLPPRAAKLIEYVQEKATGRYVHNTIQLRRFIARLPIELRTATLADCSQKQWRAEEPDPTRLYDHV
jgi:predicted DNA-binding transcriptional regulator AlpA